MFVPWSWARRIDGVNGPRWKSDHALLTPHSWTVTAEKWEPRHSVPARRSRASETQMPPSTPPRPLSLPLLNQFSTIPFAFPLACAHSCDQPTVLYLFPPERDMDPRFGASFSVASGGRPSKLSVSVGLGLGDVAVHGAARVDPYLVFENVLS